MFNGSCWVKACGFIEVLHYRYPVFSGANSLFLLSWSTVRLVQRQFIVDRLQRPAVPVQLDSEPGVLQWIGCACRGRLSRPEFESVLYLHSTYGLCTCALCGGKIKGSMHLRSGPLVSSLLLLSPLPPKRELRPREETSKWKISQHYCPLLANNDRLGKVRLLHEHRD